jgi:hypothetical protein
LQFTARNGGQPEEAPLKLYYSTNLNPRLAVAVARHLKSPVEFIRASPRDPRYEEAFRPINPNTLVPVLIESGRSYGRPMRSLAGCHISPALIFGRPATHCPRRSDG